MDWMQWGPVLKKYRWAAAVVLLGLMLLMLPQEEEEEAHPVLQMQEETGLQQALEALLSDLEGAGKVKVLLTEHTGEEIWYQADEDVLESEAQADVRSKTVLITSPDRSEQGLVRRRDPPRYLGAVVLCQGADCPQVKLAVVDAVATATGLTTDRISVWKLQ